MGHSPGRVEKVEVSGMRRTLLTTICLLLVSASAWAQHKRRDRDVLIDNTNKVLTIYKNPVTVATPTVVTEGDRDRATLRATQTIYIHPNEWMQVGIDRHNPLIFEYAWKGVALTPTADYNAAVAFAGSLKDMAGLSPFANFEAAAMKAVVAAAAISPAAEVAAFRLQVDAKVSRVRAISAAAGFGDAEVREIAALRNALAAQALAIPKLRRATLVDADLVKSQTVVAGWDVSKQANDANRLFAALTNARGALIEELLADPTLLASDPAFSATINMVGNEEGNVRKLLGAVTEFASGMALVGTRLPLGEPISFDAANSATATVQISYAKGAQDLVFEQFKTEAARPVTTPIQITFEPYSGLVIGGGPAVLYVFRKDTDGKNIGLRPVGMLSLTKRSWIDGLTYPQLEFGVTPESDRVGAYLGVGLKVRNAFHLSFGITAQQFKKEDASDWMGSGYLGVTIDLVPKK